MTVVENSRGLLLVGHGSLVTDAASRDIRALAEELRNAAEFDEVGVAFWRERPTLREAWAQFTAANIVCVPMLAASGWFYEVVLPRELGLAGPATRIGPRRVVYTAAVGMHPTMTDVLLERAAAGLLARKWDREATTLLLIGHGTERRRSSRDTVERHAEQARAAGFAAVVTAFIDAAPGVRAVCAEIATPQCVAVPFFMTEGPHTQVDIPSALSGCGFPVEITPPVGTDPSIERVVQELAAAASSHFDQSEFAATQDPWHQRQGRGGASSAEGWTPAVARFQGRLSALRQASMSVVRGCVHETCTRCSRSPIWIEAETGQGTACPDPCPELMEHVLATIKPRRG